MTRGKVLVYGATGSIGFPVTLAIARYGYDTSAVLRAESITSKAQQVATLKAAGVNIIEGSLDSTEDEHVRLMLDKDVVVSAISGTGFDKHQQKLIKAAAKANIKRFIPSEFGHDSDLDIPTALLPILGPKRETRKLLRASGVPYTFVVSHMFSGWTLPTLGDISKVGQGISDKVAIFDGGNHKSMIFADETNIADYTARALLDPRTENKVLRIAPPSNTFWSQNQIVDLYEKIGGKPVERIPVSADQMRQAVDDAPDVWSKAFAEMLHYLWVREVYTEEHINVEASDLYPDVHVITAEGYFNSLLAGRTA